MKVVLRPRPNGRFFVKVMGPNGAHELLAAVDTASEICLIHRADAVELGYNASYIPNVPNAAMKTKVVTPWYALKVPFVTLTRVEVGDLAVEGVLTAAQDISEEMGLGFVLGRNFMQGLRLSYDFPNGEMVLEKTEEASP
jgi:hypothetical protein